MIWQARSIWLSGENEGREVLVFLRRRFRLGDRPRVASAFAAASVPYRLFVNGAAIGRGPATAPPGTRYFESYDVAAQLQRGVNVLTVLCHGPAAALSFCAPGFQLQATIERQGEAPIQILSDETWMARWQGLPGEMARAEWWSLAEELRGWLAAEYDDAHWRPAETLAVEPSAPLPRPIPPSVEQWLVPASTRTERAEHPSPPVAVTAVAVGSVPAGAKGATLLYAPPSVPSPDPPAPLQEGRSSPSDSWVSLEPGERRVYDFGRQVTGFPRLRLLHGARGVLVAAYGAGIDEDGRVISSEHPDPDQWELAPKDGAQELETFHSRSFRYLQLSLEGAPAPVELDGVRLQEVHYPWVCRGRFECSDEALTRIWALGRDTLVSGVRDSFVAAPGEQGPVWLGEARLQALIDYAAFGDGRLSRKLLLETAAWEPRPTVLDEAASWVILLWEHFLQTGDRTLLQQLYPAARVRLSLLGDHRDETGLLSVEQGSPEPAAVWVDDAALDRRGAVTAANAFYHRALLTTARLAASMAHLPAQHEYEHRARALRNAANWRLWSTSDHAYADCHTRAGIGRRVSAETNWLAIAFGLAEPARAVELAQSLDRWGEWRAEPSPFFQGYALEALYALDAEPAATARIRRLWSPFLAAGATTCWQEWPAAPVRAGERTREEPSGRAGERASGRGRDPIGDEIAGSDRSLTRSPARPLGSSQAPVRGAACWPPAGAPTYFLTRETLGVRPLAPGWVRARIRPVLGDLEWLRGVAPTPLGEITLECRRRGERAVDLLASIPAGMRVEIGLSDVAERDVVEWEGRVIWPAAQAHRGVELEHLPHWGRDGWTWLVTGPREVRLRVRD